MLGQDDGEQEEEQPKMLAKEDKRKGCGKSFATVQKLATHSRYCPDAKALHEGQQEPTEPKQTKEEKEESHYRDGEGEPNEILRHTFTMFPRVRRARKMKEYKPELFHTTVEEQIAKITVQLAGSFLRWLVSE